MFTRLRRLVQLCETILAIVGRIEARQIAQGHSIMSNIDDAISAVRAEGNIILAASTALTTIQSQLTDAQAQIVSLKAAADAGQADPAKVQELLDMIATSSAQLSAAIPANTSAPIAGQPVSGVAGQLGTGAGAAGTVSPATPLAGTPGVAPVVADAPGTVAAPTAADSTSAGALSGAPVIAPTETPSAGTV